MRLQDHLPEGVRLPGIVLAVLIALVLTSAFMLNNLFTLLGTSMVASVQSEDANVVGRLLENNRVLEVSEKRFTGRSMFYLPRAPRVPTPPPPPREPAPPPREPEPPPPPPPPSIPTSYGGPAITGLLGTDVFFDNGKRIPVGEESDGVEVLAILTPFEVRVAWKGGEFDVNLFTEELPDFFGKPPFEGEGASDLLSLEVPPAPGQVARPANSRTGSGASPRSGSSGRPTAGAPTEIPGPLTEDAIQKMSRMDAIRALTRINSALRGQDVPDDVKARLSEERGRLEVRIRSESGG